MFISQVHKLWSRLIVLNFNEHALSDCINHLFLQMELSYVSQTQMLFRQDEVLMMSLLWTKMRAYFRYNVARLAEQNQEVN